MTKEQLEMVTSDSRVRFTERFSNGNLLITCTGPRTAETLHTHLKTFDIKVVKTSVPNLLIIQCS